MQQIVAQLGGLRKVHGLSPDTRIVLTSQIIGSTSAE